MSLSDRVTKLKDGAANPGASYVLYWMQMFRRARHNHALNFAIRIANEQNLPLLVYEGLKHDYPWASDRLHTFILEGVETTRAELNARGINYHFYLQRSSADLRKVVAELCERAAVLVTDDYPCFVVPGHNRSIIRQVSIPVYAVDANGLVPLSAFSKQEFAARTIRPKIHRLLPEHLAPIETPVLKQQQRLVSQSIPDTIVTVQNISALVSECAIDHAVAPSSRLRGGAIHGRERLRYFVDNLLNDYALARNEPSVDGSSRLSAYLHFGFVSASEVAYAVNHSNAKQASKDAFLEELIVRRELSFNLTHFNPQYTSLAGLDAWARKTMQEHAADPRPVTYSPEQMERAETADELWNAAQRELLHTGLIHNYVRMLWGKKVIEWCPTYAQAFDLLVHLNNKYALDGRDPNSYAGILWCFGKHDRAWGPERPVFGKLRYMASHSMARKFNAKAYIAWTRSLQATAQ